MYKIQQAEYELTLNVGNELSTVYISEFIFKLFKYYFCL